MSGLSTRAIFAHPDAASPREQYEARLAGLEGGGLEGGGLAGGARGVAFSAPEAAISALLDLLECGSHVIVSRDLPAPTARIFEDLRRRTSGLRFSYVEGGEEAVLTQALVPETRMIWVGHPQIPAHGRADFGRDAFAKIAAFAKAHDLISVCDNSRATPTFQRPLEAGFDLTVYGMPSYLHGGAKPRIGAVAVAADQDALADKLDFMRRVSGAIPSQSACAQASAGLASVALRMARVAENVDRLGAYFAAHPGCLEQHPDPDAACLGGAVSVTLSATGAEVRASLERLALIAVTSEPDGLRSTAEHPASMSQAAILPEIRSAFGIVDGLVLFHLGIEDGDDLIADLRHAFGA